MLVLKVIIVQKEHLIPSLVQLEHIHQQLV